MRLVRAVLVSIFICNTAWATVYEWVDSQGVVHMTDNPDKVPAAYRKVMRTREIDTRDAATPAAAPQSETVGAPVPPPVEAGLYGGHDENWWRTSFGEARGNHKALQDQIDEKKKSLAEIHRRRVLYQKPSDRVAYFALADEIARDEENASALQDSLAKLEYQADGAGVPPEWRK